MRSHLAITVATLVLSIGGFAACGSLDSLGGGGFGGTIEPPNGPGTGGIGADPQGVGGGGAEEGFNYAEHCGVEPTCIPGPGDNGMCTVADGGMGGGGGMGGAGGNGSGGAGGGLNGSGGAGGGTTGVGGAGGAGETIVADCRLTYDEEGVTQTICVETEVDLAIPGDPCTRSEQCGAGMACVAIDGGNTSCRPYCCGNVEDCPADDSYCALAPVAAGDLEDLPGMLGAEDVKPIPVCAPADGCALDGSDELCDEGEVCTVVRLTGRVTACVTPGNGLNGDACPCAAGHFCNTDENRCLQLCETNTPDACPEGFSCQGGVGSVPEPWGTCVGTY